MNEPKQPGDQPAPEHEAPANGAADAASPSTAADSEAVNPEPAADGGDLAAELEAARAKADENWNAYLRASAELENVRRRAERDVANAQRYALEKPISDLLGAIDSLELGLKSAEDESAGREAVIEGMRLTLKQLVQALERHGLSRVDPAGEAFDPEQHEAVSMVESDQVPPQHVLDVMQPGYRLNERLLRPAMVIVAKAPAAG